MSPKTFLAYLHSRRAVLTEALAQAEEHRNCLRGGLAEIDYALSQIEATAGPESPREGLPEPESSGDAWRLAECGEGAGE